MDILANKDFAYASLTTVVRFMLEVIGYVECAFKGIA